jgi:DNA invertase Pin-like site-specific DNA recombinase
MRPRQVKSPDAVGEERTLVVLRVSHQSSTTETQLFGMQEYIDSLAYKPAIWQFTASNWRKAIPEMVELVKDIEKGKWKEVVLWKVDRCGRDHEYDVDLWKACRRNKVVLRFIEDDIINTREDDDIAFHYASLEGMKYRRQLSKATKLGIARLRARCAKQGLPDPFIGKTKGCLWTTTKEAIPGVVAMFHMGLTNYKIRKAARIGYQQIAKLRHMPIEELRRQSGDTSLKDWR